MTTRTRNRRASTPAYYLARPAGLWLAALAPRPTERTSAPAGDEPCEAEPSDARHSAAAKG
jgi:hypothetical protein